MKTYGPIDVKKDQALDELTAEAQARGAYDDPRLPCPRCGKGGNGGGIVKRGLLTKLDIIAIAHATSSMAAPAVADHCFNDTELIEFWDRAQQAAMEQSAPGARDAVRLLKINGEENAGEEHE